MYAHCKSLHAPSFHAFILTHPLAASSLDPLLTLCLSHYPHPSPTAPSLTQIRTHIHTYTHRHGATSVGEFASQGFLAPAMINFLSLLGWNDGTEQEIYQVTGCVFVCVVYMQILCAFLHACCKHNKQCMLSCNRNLLCNSVSVCFSFLTHTAPFHAQPDELTQKFSLERITKSAAVFDKVKLSWMNGQHIKLLPEEEVRMRACMYACLRVCVRVLCALCAFRGSLVLASIISLASLHNK